MYQRERFPIVAHGILIAVFSLSAIAYSAALRGAPAPLPYAAAVAFATAFLFFLQLRVLDEFKDHDEDVRYRPYRPVPRGLVTLGELGWVAFGAALLQLVLAVSLNAALTAWLAGVWMYIGLMRVEFFSHRWLTAHPFAYLTSHMIVVPLIALYVTAGDWLQASSSPPPSLVWFLLASFCNGIVIEIGRKVRAPDDEERGVPTYTAAWGIRMAVLGWIIALAATAIFALVAANRINATTLAIAVLAPALGLVVATGWDFVREPSAARTRRVEDASGLWALLVYLVLGLAPLATRV